MNRTLVATARKKLLRRGRAMLRSAQSSQAGASALGGMNEPQILELREIHAALERIERGIFGRCDTCQGSIEETCLEATPWERDCATCRGEDILAVSSVLATA
ncbi:MAG TPA: hypothetical protein VMZ28_05695 [Kofleriaceae bacterium]|nr:hypothetical protein [Kofleriaceae bacterium]